MSTWIWSIPPVLLAIMVSTVAATRLRISGYPVGWRISSAWVASNLLLGVICIRYYDTNQIFVAVYVYLIVWPIILTAIILSRQSSRISGIWSIAFLATAASPLVLLLLSWPAIIWATSLGLIPTAGDPIGDADMHDTIDIDAIRYSFENLRSSIQGMEAQFDAEVANIERIETELLADIEAKNMNLEQMMLREEELRTQIDHLKQIIAIEEPQAKALLAEFRRGKTQEYIWGLVSGFVASVSASASIAAIRKYRSRRNSDINQ